MNIKHSYSIFLFIIMILTGIQVLAKDDSVQLATGEIIPNTDGYGLLLKPPSPSKEESEKIFKQAQLSCQSDCVTPAGKILGVVDGVKAFSNCKSTCIQSEYSFFNLKNKEVSIHKFAPKDENQHYIGLIYQCVEYARRWWMKNEGITFGDIDSAYEIIYLKEGKDLYTKSNFPLARSINGSARRAPQRGDLIIYYPNMDDPKWRYGHVAVVVDVDLEKGIVSLAEQNYNNLAWDNHEKFARQIRLFNIGGRYRLLDVGTTDNKNINGGLISGWIYPASKKLR
ncbi:MAG: CHAP domain-containing protein [Pseudomonadota bacterium]